MVFAPFHYGYFDQADPDRHNRAANELTRTEWDPVSKQPIFKVTAVRVHKIADAAVGGRPVVVDEPGLSATGDGSTSGGAAGGAS